MNQNNGSANQSVDNLRKSEKNWFNEHDQPSPEYLQSLAQDGSPEALEKLKSIADDLDVEYDPDTSVDDLVDGILSAIRNDPNSTT